jgi:hypothetical protein
MDRRPAQEVFQFDVIMDARVATVRPTQTSLPCARAGLSGRRGSIAPVLVNYADSTVKELRWR